MVLVAHLEPALQLCADKVQIALQQLLDSLAHQRAPLLPPQPHLNKGLLLVLAQTHADYVAVQLVAHQSEHQVLPDMVQCLRFAGLFGVFELEEEASAVEPLLPPGHAFFFEEHHLHVHLVLRRQFHRAVV